MSFAKVYSAQTSLLKAHIVSVEIDLSNGLHSFSIVGLPDKGVEEARDRVGAAIKNSGYKSPKQKNQKIVVSLAPADIKKEGAVFDLAIAVGYLLADEEIKFNPDKKLFIGELSLDGELRGIRGILPMIREAKRQGFEEVYLPLDNAEEASFIKGITIYGAQHLHNIIDHINQKRESDRPIKKIIPQTPAEIKRFVSELSADFADVKGQDQTKRGLEIAAAGGHNIAMYGPPGTGKTMLAKAFSGILPPLSFDDMLEITSIHSIAGTLTKNLMTEPPLRSPHHTASYTSLVGGGANPKPGEITLAHRGVLFMDELPEFDRRVIDALRQPLEEKNVSISRIKGSALFPAHFILIATMNPCPCGNHGIKGKECICSAQSLERYKRKISGPIIDRIDMWVEVSTIDYQSLSNLKKGEKSASIRERIIAARAIQENRFKIANLPMKTNSDLNAKHIEELIPLSPEVKTLLNTSAQKLDLSARSYHRIIKLSRTIADLDQKEHIEIPHLLEAFQYRPKKT